jgi:hypothetical protein
VGISFAMKRSLVEEGFAFNPGAKEDFDLLNRLQLAPGITLDTKQYVLFGPHRLV